MIKKASEKLNVLMQSGSKLKLYIIIGLCVVGVILMSGAFTGGQKNISNEMAFDENTYNREYVAAMESNLTELISGIDGAGAAKVYVTLEYGVSYEYARDKKSSSDTNSKSGGDSQTSFEEEQSVKVIGQSGGALVIRRNEPVVLGIAVSCQGGDNINVKMSVVEAVSTLCGVTSNRVSVTKK
ncbi:MAG: hypothetical protein RSD19_08380, partial [Oscillospiraceae bacterium]